MPEETPKVSLWRHRDFALYWTGQTVDQFGSQVSWLAVPLIAIVVLHATKFEVAALAAASSLPALLVSLPAAARRRPGQRPGDLPAGRSQRPVAPLRPRCPAVRAPGGRDPAGPGRAGRPVAGRRRLHRADLCRHDGADRDDVGAATGLSAGDARPHERDEPLPVPGSPFPRPLVGGALATWLSLRPTLLLLAGLTLSYALVFVLSPFRTMREIPVHEAYESAGVCGLCGL